MGVATVETQSVCTDVRPTLELKCSAAFNITLVAFLVVPHFTGSVSI